MMRLLDGQYDVIVSHSHPFAAHLIASDLKKRRIAKKWVALLWDPFVFNAMNPEKDIEKRKESANIILSRADSVLVMDGIMSHNYTRGWIPAYTERVRELHLPTLLSRCNNSFVTSSCSEETTITFAGAFYANIREPDIALKVLSQMPQGYSIHLYGNGCRKAIKNIASEFVNSVLIDHGVVSHEECEKAICESNILLNIGNTVVNQLPSKVFEYISYGKPIINFYFRDDDIGLKYFKKYPLCYNMNLNSYNMADIEGLIKFCHDNKHKMLTFDQATEQLKDYKAENIIGSILKEIA